MRGGAKRCQVKVSLATRPLETATIRHGPAIALKESDMAKKAVLFVCEGNSGRSRLIRDKIGNRVKQLREEIERAKES